MRRLGITDRVQFNSGSDRALAARYEEADTAFIYPSKYEGFGLPPLEAMSHGCPWSVATPAPSLKSSETPASTQDPNSIDDLRSALERVATTDTLQADLRVRGYAPMGAFSWDKMRRGNRKNIARSCDPYSNV